MCVFGFYFCDYFMGDVVDHRLGDLMLESLDW